MDDLVRWLGQQLDEDERIARALVDDKRPGRADPWEFCDDGSIRDASRRGSLRVKFTWAPEAEHIIRHDPARVLREIDAKRQTLAELEAAEQAMDQAARDHDTGRYNAARADWVVLRRIVHRDAAVYADRPDAADRATKN